MASCSGATSPETSGFETVAADAGPPTCATSAAAAPATSSARTAFLAIPFLPPCGAAPLAPPARMVPSRIAERGGFALDGGTTYPRQWHGADVGRHRAARRGESRDDGGS